MSMFTRIAHHIAVVEEQWDGDASEAQALFYDLLTDMRFVPNSPTFTGAGTPLGQLAACFVLPIEDDMGPRLRRDLPGASRCGADPTDGGR